MVDGGKCRIRPAPQVMNQMCLPGENYASNLGASVNNQKSAISQMCAHDGGGGGCKLG